ncbi:DUF2841 domain-containing protein [Aspergillus fischeri NRRL 181]|uniref:Subtelomeric hrmA-associated cluster protein AFUB-079030/YDR124W-like helical bundle domain-containing protein n=1 Tax=Neosartorya fischeri (strain ATCC 1020 / DSM 3700 / CBS 544.65 / FGSC A1164 / JCM 1740 / NRRL 181 / WB 181) TaxID=331117 RepID=A1DA31_NEOFI|nr:uncharacterized protein NFIA_030950 [Aspergillus fischeri NRRL 181]EAW20662.1 hypothetical protein NFIA_030950 [Aspergillus fischeri NRRL 181]
MMYLDHLGQLGVVESPSIQGHGPIFTTEAQNRFMEILERSEQRRRKSLVCSMITVPARFISQLTSSVLGAPTTPCGYGQPHDTAYHHEVKCVNASVDNSESPVSLERFSQPFQETSESFTEKVLMIGDTAKIVAYYESCFKELRQKNCTLIAKAFIKFIEPKKRAKHPYKGLKRLKGDRQSTKPDWWPSDVPHKEPDHLLKDQRLRLLIHILRNLGGRRITSHKLQVVAGDYARQLHPRKEIEMKMKILNNIFKVRGLEEQYECRKIDPCTRIYIDNDRTIFIEFGGHEATSDAKEEVASEELDDL